MKIAIMFAGLACLAVSGCADWTLNDARNPNGADYVGTPGSTYDSAGNPARTIGTVAYDPKVTVQPSDVLPTPAGTAPGMGTAYPPRR